MPAERWLGRPLAETRGWLELARLLADPVFRGAGVPHGDGRPVVLMPGFLAGDQTLSVIAAWLQRLGYRPQFCGFVLNAGCSDRTLDRLERRVDALWRSSGRRVALIGHSRGGHFARALAARRPDRVSHAISMGADLQGLFGASTPTLLAVDVARRVVHASGRARKDACLSRHCGCPFSHDFARPFPSRAGAAHEHLLKGRRSRPLAIPGDPRRRLHRGDRQPHRARLQPQGVPRGGRRVGAARVAPGLRSPQPRVLTFDLLRRFVWANDSGVVVSTRLRQQAGAFELAEKELLDPPIGSMLLAVEAEGATRSSRLFQNRVTSGRTRRATRVRCSRFLGPNQVVAGHEPADRARGDCRLRKHQRPLARPRWADSASSQAGAGSLSGSVC